MIPHFGEDNPWYLAGNAPTPVAAYQARGAESYAASLINLVTPGTYNLTEGNGAVTWSAAAGWQFVEAEAKYLNTGIVVDTGNWSMLVQFAAVHAAEDSYLANTYTGAGRQFGVSSDRGNNLVRFANGATVLNVAISPDMIAGNLAIAGQQGYRDGAALGGALAAWSGTGTRPVPIGATNNAGTMQWYVTANIYAIAFYNTALTAAQVLAVAAAMAAL